MAGTIRWTRAHRKVRGDESQEELRDIRGNEAADEAAKSARDLHPPIGVHAMSQLQFYERRINYVVRAVVAALRLYPRAPGNMPRAPRPATRQQAVQRRRHFWQHRGGAWRCALCHDWSNAVQLPRSRKHQRCRGRTLFDEAAAITRKGQGLVRAEAEIPFAYCGQCGAWAISGPITFPPHVARRRPLDVKPSAGSGRDCTRCRDAVRMVSCGPAKRCGRLLAIATRKRRGSTWNPTLALPSARRL